MHLFCGDSAALATAHEFLIDCCRFCWCGRSGEQRFSSESHVRRHAIPRWRYSFAEMSISHFFSFLFNHAKSDPSYADCAQEKKIRWLLWARTNWISTWTDLRYTPKFLWWSRIQSTSQDGQCAWKKKGADTITTTTTKKFTIVFGRGGWSVATGE